MTVVFLIGMVLSALAIGLLAYYRGHRSGMGYGVLAARDEIQAAREEARQAREAFEHCRGQWTEWERKAESFRSINSSILDERDKWQHLYTDQSVAHGNAQAIMMGAIEYMGKKLSAHGIPFQVPPVLQEVRAAFIDNHVTPALAQTDQATIKPEKSSEKSGQVG